MPLGKRSDCGEARYAGLDVSFFGDLNETLQSSLDCGFDFMVVPLVDPRKRRAPTRLLPSGQLPPPFTRSDLLLNSSQWSGQVVGRVSPWIDPDSPDQALASDSAAALRQELEWAAHLSLQAVVLPRVAQPLAAANYARILNQVMNGLSSMSLWQPIPLSGRSEDDAVAASPAPAAAAAAAGGKEAPGEDGGRSKADGAAAAAAANTEAAAAGEKDGRGKAGGAAAAVASTEDTQRRLWAERESDPWEWWHQVRTLCEHHPKLGVVLELPATLPPQEEIERWYGEPVRAILVHTSLFITNRKGYPTLSKRHQQVLGSFMRLSVQVLLTGTAAGDDIGQDAAADEADTAASAEARRVLAVTPDGEGVAPEHPLRLHWEYLSFLFRKQDNMHPEEAAEINYRDYLQAPLQPLQDNLESATYETFERDSAKYVAYEEAVYRALLDRVPDSDASSRTTVLMVVGAGRGPLVRASLSAAERSGRKLRVYAVEKNPNAIITLQNLVASEGWGDVVTVVGCDMRVWQATEKADILVSELLGSFGDNELSPECLDGAQRFLAPGGISIPRKYTSYLQPVTTTKLWNDVKAYDDLEHFETPYVVKLWRHTPLAETQPVFTFEHPNTDEHIDNTRSISLEFDRPGRRGAVCHGFAGYFDTHLYGDVWLSIHPVTHTSEMFSWFPIYFPLRSPMYVPPGAPVKVNMWRCARAHKVWYEWCLTKPQATPIHNPKGRSYYVGL